MQGLSQWLETIGQESAGEPTTDPEGNIRSMTKDECLARSIWKRALGWDEVVEHPNGTESHKTHSPDPKAQQFIIERREGKYINAPEVKKTRDPLTRIADKVRQDSNTIAEQSANETDTISDSVPDTDSSMD